MKIKALLPKFRRKNKGNDKINDNNDNHKQMRKKKRRVIKIGSPSSTSRTNGSSDRHWDDEDSDGLYHPEYIPPPSTKFHSIHEYNRFDDLEKEEPAVGETSLISLMEEVREEVEESKQPDSLSNNLLTEDTMIGELASPSNLLNKRMNHNGVSSQMVWMNATLLDDSSDDDENIFASEYLSEKDTEKLLPQTESLDGPDVVFEDGYEEEVKREEESNHTSIAPYTTSKPRPKISLASLALDSTRASNMYRIYESDFDDFGLATGVDVVDESTAVSQKNYPQKLRKQVEHSIVPYDLNAADDHGNYIPPKNSGVPPLGWCSLLVPDMSLPVPPGPESEFPLDELDHDVRQLMMEDDVSALSSTSTILPAIYRDLQKELRLKPPITANRIADMFSKVFHCQNTEQSNVIEKPPTLIGTTIALKTRPSPTDYGYYERVPSDITSSPSPFCGRDHVALIHESIIYDV